MPEPEILAVRQLATEAADDSVTRSWYRITQLQAQKARPLRGRRLIPVMAAAVVVLMAVSTFVVMKVGEGRFWPTASTPQAIATLDALADTAAAGTTAPAGPDQLVKADIDAWGARFGGANGVPDSGIMLPQDRVAYFDPHTGEMVKIIQDGRDLLREGEKANTDPHDPITPGIHFPTVSWVASLPADPQQLLAALRIAVGDNDSWSVDQQVWNAMGQLYHDFEAALTPQQRASLLRALAGMSGLTARFVTIDGLSLVGFRFTEGDRAEEIYFDPFTGRAVGRAGFSFHAGLTVEYPPGESFEPGQTYRATWVQSIVDRSEAASNP